ncbi:hypothetical protein Tco_0837783 [Tanacetum coccineum]
MQLYGGGRIPFQLKSDSLHAHAQTTKTYYKHQDSSIKKAQVLKTKTSAYSDIKDNSSEIKLRGRLLESFQDDANTSGVDGNGMGTGAKVQEEPHHDIRTTLQRLPFYCTPPAAIDAVIPDPTLEDLAVGTPSAKILAKAEASQKRKASTFGDT